MNLAYWLNTAWMWSCQREARAFDVATHSVTDTQQAVLRKIISQNAKTEFGRQYDFHSVRSVSDFQQRVPLSTHDAYLGAIEQIAAGQANVLTGEPVELLEPTSGTTRGEKLIPYTAALRSQFQRAIAVWVADVMRQRPALRRGRAYWSISPAWGTKRITSGGIPIGFDDDTAYLGRLERLFLPNLLVMPPEITQLTSIENFRYLTLLHLLAAGDLSLVSIWSPTFLTSLLSQLDSWSDRLSRDLRRGRASQPVTDDTGVSASLLTPRCGVERAEEVGHILRSDDRLPGKLLRLWPQLDLISCWADATAGTYLGGLRELFPHVTVQPKGLLSTEACVSLPLVGRPGAALALRSHFFEFVTVGDAGAGDPVRLADQLEAGQRYEVVVTTGGGLYRYQLRDVVEVVGFAHECPLLTFVGRADLVSDLVGEKLSESHVSRILQQVCLASGFRPRFAMLVPVATPAGYRLYLEADAGRRSQGAEGAILGDVDAGLRQNPHYRYALQLGQLQPLEIRLVAEGHPGLWQTYERVLLARGQKAGEIKPAALDWWTGWCDEFELAIAVSPSPFSPVVE